MLQQIFLRNYFLNFDNFSSTITCLQSLWTLLYECTSDKSKLKSVMVVHPTNKGNKQTFWMIQKLWSRSRKISQKLSNFLNAAFFFESLTNFSTKNSTISNYPLTRGTKPIKLNFHRQWLQPCTEFLITWNWLVCLHNRYPRDCFFDVKRKLNNQPATLFLDFANNQCVTAVIISGRQLSNVLQIFPWFRFLSFTDQTLVKVGWI